jgi:hypothetical protein
VRVEIAILTSMESCSLKLPEIPSSEQTPLVQRLLQIIVEQQKRIEEFRRGGLKAKAGDGQAPDQAEPAGARENFPGGSRGIKA